VEQTPKALAVIVGLYEYPVAAQAYTVISVSAATTELYRHRATAKGMPRHLADTAGFYLTPEKRKHFVSFCRGLLLTLTTIHHLKPDREVVYLGFTIVILEVVKVLYLIFDKKKRGRFSPRSP